MKRVSLFLTVISMIFLLTACESKEKELNCSKAYDQNGVNIKENYLYSLKSNGKFKSAKIIEEVTVSDAFLKIYSLETYKENFKNGFEQGIQSKNMDLSKLDYDISTEGTNKIIMKINFKDSNAIKSFTGIDEIGKSNLEKVKSNFETKNFICTVN